MPALTTLALVGIVLTACGTTPADTPSGTASGTPSGTVSSQPAPGSARGSDAGSGSGSAARSEAYGHVHGMAVGPGSDRVLLATHHGLFDAADDSFERIGPQIDLMGFTPAADGTLYASGHPHPDTGIAEPAGLLRSTDGGASWDTVSREGESDFHALATAGEGFVAFDGLLRTSADGASWETVSAGPVPFALAGSASGAVLATTERGVWTSEDGGRSWDEPAGGPVLLVVAFADEDTAVGVEPDGTVHTSDDAGGSWVEEGSAEVTPAAVTARRNDDGTLEAWIADGTGAVLHSTDGGETFRVPED